MTVRISKSEINLRDKLSNHDNPTGAHGGQILASKSAKETQSIIGIGTKNMLINGGMQIAQRGTSLTPNGSSSTQFPCCDRWGGQFSDTGVMTVSQSTDAPTGHTHSLKYLVSSALTPSGGHYFWIGQRIEGYNIAPTGWNTPFGKHCTLSFWVKSSNPGIWAGSVRKGGSTFGYCFVYEIENKDTWEWKQVTVPPPTTSSSGWNVTNGVGIQIQFDIGTSRVSDLGADTIGKWQSHNTYTHNDTILPITRLHGTSGGTWYLTGVQFEPGRVATPFEQRSYGEEIALCQRYYNCIYRRGASSDGNLSIGGVGSLYTSTQVYIDLSFPTQMRATPTLEAPTATNRFNICPTTCIDFGNPNLIHAHKNACTLNATLQSSNTAGRVGNVFAKTSNWTEGEKLAFTAEL